MSVTRKPWAADHAAQRDARILGDMIDRRFKLPSADIVEHHVDAIGKGLGQLRAQVATGLVVQAGVIAVAARRP